MKKLGWFVLLFALVLQFPLSANNGGDLEPAPMNTEGEKLLQKYLEAVIQLREVYYGSYKKDSHKFVNDFPKGSFINDEEQEYFRSQIELYGISPMKVEKYGIRVFADDRMSKTESFFVDFSRVWDKIIVIEGHSLPLDVSLKETVEEKVIPHLRNRGILSSSSSLQFLHNLIIPSAHAGCAMNTFKGGMGAASLITIPARLPIIGTNAAWEGIRGRNPVSSIIGSTGISGIRDALGGIKDSIKH